MAELTPMMRQYLSLKEQYHDCLLFFRLGDFYEMFFDDAKLAAEELDLVLTTRDRNKPEEERTPMCGVPYHSAEAYIARLIAKGHKVAICEQTEDPALAKGIVERDIVRVVTPGTVIDASMLEDGKNNYIACLWAGSEGAGICFADISTGELSLSSFASERWKEHAINELCRYSPREVLLSPGGACHEILDVLQGRQDIRVEVGAETLFDGSLSEEVIKKQFPSATFKLPPEANAVLPAVGGLLQYLYQTQKTDLSHIQSLRFDSGGEFMELDPTARKNLELTETIRSKEKKGSLLWVLDKTKTPMGGRMIRFWLERPLLSPVSISQRLGAVAALTADPIRREELIRKLKEITDLERLIGRIVYGSAGARDLTALVAGLSGLPALRSLLEAQPDPMLKMVQKQLDDLPTLRDLISRGIVDEPPFSVREGGLIREGYHPDVDHLRDILKNSRGIIAGIEAREKEKTGIKTLKIGYNKVFGYYLEVSKSYYDQVPESYIRKQTLANCERFITQELKDMEHTILSAEDRLTVLEFELFCELREAAAAHVSVIQRSAAAVGRLDVLASFAAVAAENHYAMPSVDLSDQLEIVEGRHPVVEKMLKDSLFVPNDTRMDGKQHRASIITGPNMAGKSTYMRQVALIVLMAQIGSFVPAKSARIGVIDRVFTRIGASDDLAGGQSTFMVEMSEVAEILKNATSKSLLILDEIGRGTSTYDGMAIARAVLEWCADPKRLGAKTLFATHYHELTCLEDELPGVLNFNIAAKKRNDQIIFLRKILSGKADESYGVEVAKLAGVPERVVFRSRELLKELEAEGAIHQKAERALPLQDQISMEQLKEAEVLRILRETSLETLTPLEAMNLLYGLKQKL
jgi:DNA mismatch repair protein MutS